MQTIAQAKIAGAQMRVQEGIAKRNALISFMNTAIEGAKTPAEIMAGRPLRSSLLSRLKPRGGNQAYFTNRLALLPLRPF